MPYTTPAHAAPLKFYVAPARKTIFCILLSLHKSYTRKTLYQKDAAQWTDRWMGLGWTMGWSEVDKFKPTKTHKCANLLLHSIDLLRPQLFDLHSLTARNTNIWKQIFTATSLPVIPSCYSLLPTGRTLGFPQRSLKAFQLRRVSWRIGFERSEDKEAKMGSKWVRRALIGYE